VAGLARGSIVIAARLWCWLVGHAASERVWEPWHRSGELGRYRLLVTRCQRCHDVWSLQSEVEGEPC